MSVPDFSALHCPPRHSASQSQEKAPLRQWNVEQIAALSSSLRPRTHPCFDPAAGLYIVAVDGLYSLVVQLIPIGVARYAHSSPVRRAWVDYVIRVQEPPAPDAKPEDTIESEFYDVGSVNFAQVVHLKKGTSITCMKMPNCAASECVRLKIELLQRKRKRPAPPELTKKEMKKRKKIKRKADSAASPLSSPSYTDNHKTPTPHRNSETSPPYDTSEDDDDDEESDWSHGFESDTTADDLPYSKRGVGRLAKRFKATARAQPNSP